MNDDQIRALIMGIAHDVDKRALDSAVTGVLRLKGLDILAAELNPRTLAYLAQVMVNQFKAGYQAGTQDKNEAILSL